MKKILFLATLCICACTAPKKISNGVFVITEISQRGPGYVIVKFEGNKLKYQVLNDTLLPFDTILINGFKISKRRRQ
jgi:hypothetical protein